MQRMVAIMLIMLGGCHPDNAAREMRMNRESDAEALAGDVAGELETRHGGVVVDDAFDARMAAVLTRVVSANPNLEDAYQIAKLRDEGINAYSLPPGRIYLTQGLYERIHSDNHLAAILCHEIAHIERRDHYQPRCLHGDAALHREIEADAQAVAYLRDAEIDVVALEEVVEVIRDVQAEGWADRRIAALTATASATD